MLVSHLPSFKTTYRRDAESEPPRLSVLSVRGREAPHMLLAHVFVEAEERRVEVDGALSKASLELHHELIVAKHSNMAGHGTSFGASYSASQNLVCLTSTNCARGAVFMDLPGLKGQRVGTYLMDRLVAWAQQWPDAEVLPVELLGSDASEKNKERRNRFYEQFGLVFDYADPITKQAGRSRPMRVRELRRTEAWRANIEVLQVHEYLGGVLFDAERLARELQDREGALSDALIELKEHRRSPIWWALRETSRRAWQRAWPWLMLLSLVAMGMAALMRRR